LRKTKLFEIIWSNNLGVFGLDTCNQIIDLSYDITNCFNNENLICVDAIFLDKNDAKNANDTKDAFGFVRFKWILEHFYQIGLRNNALTILESYLTENKSSSIIIVKLIHMRFCF
jgi:hypothetical protein